jgi:hypothetical protein
METTDPTILKPSGNEQIPSIGPVSGEPPTLGVTSSPTASGGHLQPSPTTIESPTPVLPSSKVAPASQSPPANEKSEGPIKYRVEFINIFGSVIYQHDMEGPHFESRSPPTKNHAFTIVTTFRTAKEHFVEGEELSGTSPTKTMHISSKAIEQALRSVVKYYPSQDLASDVIKIQYPYAVLVHHYDELMEYRERFNPEKFLDASKVCFREKDAYEHLGVLKDFLDQEIMPLVEEEKARNRRGQATFDMLWLIKQPGKAFICYLGSDKEKIAGVIHSVDMGSFVNPTRSWTINYWNLNYGGDTIGRQLSNYLENKYTGERDIDDIVDLDVYPHSLMVHEAIQSGKTFWNLLQKQCKHYKGRTTTYPHNEVSGAREPYQNPC